MPAPELDPGVIADSAGRLRGVTLSLLDQCSDEDLAARALPEWSVEDVFWHLADADRGSVLVGHLAHFLPGRDLDDMEDDNDEAVARHRGRPREELRRELEVWGNRMQLVMRLTPSLLGRVRIPSAFGRVPLAWFGTLRCYDEWVHQWDITQALSDQALSDGRQLPEPQLDARSREQLAAFHLRALPAMPLQAVEQRDSVVAVAFSDVRAPTWRFDLSRHEYGPDGRAPETVTITSDVPSWSLLAANRASWKQLEDEGRLRIDGDDRDAARVFLEVVRVV